MNGIVRYDEQGRPVTNGIGRRDGTHGVSVAPATERRDGTGHESPEALVDRFGKNHEELRRFLSILARGVGPEKLRFLLFGPLDGSGRSEPRREPEKREGLVRGIRDLAIDLQDSLPLDFELFRISLTFNGSTLDTARRALAHAADTAASLGPSYGLLGSVDRRSRPSQAGEDAHLYLLVAADSRDAVCQVRDAALLDLGSTPHAQKISPLGFGKTATGLDYERCVAYLLKPWPSAVATERDHARDIVASGFLAPIWARHSATVLGHDDVASRCDWSGCSKHLPADRTKRRAFCSQSCRQKAQRHPELRRSHTATKPTNATPSSRPREQVGASVMRERFTNGRAPS